MDSQVMAHKLFERELIKNLCVGRASEQLLRLLALKNNGMSDKDVRLYLGFIRLSRIGQQVISVKKI